MKMVVKFKEGSVFGRLLKIFKKNKLQNIRDYEKKDNDFLYAECHIRGKRVAFRRSVSIENFRKIYPRESRNPYGEFVIDDKHIQFYAILDNFRLRFFFGPAKNEVTFVGADEFPCSFFMSFPLEEGYFHKNDLTKMENFIKFCAQEKRKIFSVRKCSFTMKIRKNSLAAKVVSSVEDGDGVSSFVMDGDGYRASRYNSDFANIFVYDREKRIYLRREGNHITCCSVDFNSYESSQKSETEYEKIKKEMTNFLKKFVKTKI